MIVRLNLFLKPKFTGIYMSILAKLLQKKSENENNPDSGQIPPGLLHSVARSGGSGKKTSYLVFVALGGVAAIVIGYFLVQYLKISRGTQPNPAMVTPSQPQPGGGQAAAPLAASPAATPVQPAISSSSRSAALKVAVAQQARAVLPIKKKNVVARNNVIPAVPVAVSMDKTAGSSRRSFVATADKGRASSTARKTAVKDQASIDAYLFAARNAESRHDYLTALRQYLKAQQADPSNYRIMNNVSSTFLRLGLPEDSLKFASMALAQKRDYASAMVNAGISNGRLGNEPAARSMLTRAVAIEPSNRQALFNLGLSYERGREMDDALSIYRRLANGGDAQGYLGMGRVYEKKGNRNEALGCYRDLLALPEAGQAARDMARKRISQLE